MAKLNQIIAIEKGTKAKAEQMTAGVMSTLSKANLLSGVTRTYTPKNEDGDLLPPETHLVQLKASEEVKKIRSALEDYFDVTAAKEWSNCGASADVRVDGKAVIVAAPIGYLLFLEKQVGELCKTISKLPTLDPGEQWIFNDQQNQYETEPSWQNRTAKIPYSHVKHEGDEHHPPQVEILGRDEVVGKWTTVKASGCMPKKDVADMLERANKLLMAIKQAREEANGAEATRPKVASGVLDYIGLGAV